MNSAKIILVAAMDGQGGVGRRGEIPWSCPDDLQRFKALTLGEAVCYGRKTYESLPLRSDGVSRCLKDRFNILLTRGEAPPEFMWSRHNKPAHSVREAYSLAEARNAGPLFVIGGAAAWAEAIQIIDEGVPALAYITRIYGAFDCDTFFPFAELKSWKTLMCGSKHSSLERFGSSNIFSILSKNL